MPLLRRGSISWLVLALLWAATLGQMHRIAHAPQHPRASVQADVAPHVHAALLEALLGDHDGDSGCRLFDQAAGADGLTTVFQTPPAPPLLPIFFALISLGESMARRVALCEARGPPAAH